MQHQKRALSQILVVNAFPAAVKCTLQSDDNSVTQVCTLRNYDHKIFYQEDEIIVLIYCTISKKNDE